MVHTERVQELIDLRQKLENDKHQFAIKHGFAYKRAQNFKNCIVIRWKTRTKFGVLNESFYKKAEEYADFCRHLSDKFDLWIEKFPLFENDLRLLKIGVYCFYTWDYQAWAIPNEFKEIQDYILERVPKWAKVSVKK